MTTTTKAQTCTNELHGADGGSCPGCGLDVYVVYGLAAPTTTTKADPLAVCEFCGGPTAGPLDVCTEPGCLAKDIAREALFKRLEDS